MNTTRTCVPEFVVQFLERMFDHPLNKIQTGEDHPSLAFSLSFDEFQWNGIQCEFDAMFKHVTGFELFRPRCYVAMKYLKNKSDVRAVLSM